jgi:hypothetical protein
MIHVLLYSKNRNRKSGAKPIKLEDQKEAVLPKKCYTPRGEQTIYKRDIEAPTFFARNH